MTMFVGHETHESLFSLFFLLSSTIFCDFIAEIFQNLRTLWVLFIHFFFLSRWIITKTKNGRNFLIYKIQSYGLFLYRQKESFQLHGQIGLWQIFQLSIFVLSHEKCHYQSRWESNFRFFFFFWVFYFLPLLENFSLCKRYKLRFNSHSPKKFRQMTLNWEWWRLCHSFINKREWRKRGMMF